VRKSNITLLPTKGIVRNDIDIYYNQKIISSAIITNYPKYYNRFGNIS
jgi:hypothetical protein